jgi:hypothetical protein
MWRNQRATPQKRRRQNCCFSPWMMSHGSFKFAAPLFDDLQNAEN